MSAAHTPGPWVSIHGKSAGTQDCFYIQSKGAPLAPRITTVFAQGGNLSRAKADAQLTAAGPEMLEALKEGRRAIGDHFAPNDCYATGPMTGDPIRDLVQCPACSFIAMYEAAILKATGEQA